MVQAPCTGTRDRNIDNPPLWRLVAAASSPVADAQTIEQIIDVLKVKSAPPGGAMPKILVRLRREHDNRLRRQIVEPGFPTCSRSRISPTNTIGGSAFLSPTDSSW